MPEYRNASLDAVVAVQSQDYEVLVRPGVILFINKALARLIRHTHRVPPRL